eukprot:m.373440 g.373440  ORF g.373440 m.373440 type:complete len:212 (+) comp56150_c0_seq13:711-1346(+)
MPPTSRDDGLDLLLERNSKFLLEFSKENLSTRLSPVCDIFPPGILQSVELMRPQDLEGAKEHLTKQIEKHAQKLATLKAKMATQEVHEDAQDFQHLAKVFAVSLGTFAQLVDQFVTTCELEWQRHFKVDSTKPSEIGLAAERTLSVLTTMQTLMSQLSDIRGTFSSLAAAPRSSKQGSGAFLGGQSEKEVREYIDVCRKGISRRSAPAARA